MKVLELLNKRWDGLKNPLLVHGTNELYFNDILAQDGLDLSIINSGDVVALIGDFDPLSLQTLLMLIELGVILVPLTNATKAQHEYFFDSALVDVIIEGREIRRVCHGRKHNLIEQLREIKHAGLVLFSTGTTGRPKAILHDLTLFMERYQTPRQTLKTINFLLFDHIGGINTLMHTLFNGGTVVAPTDRSVEGILKAIQEYEIEALPTTPTFLRMMLMSGRIPEQIPATLKIITYGTERMDQPTLDALCNLLPNIDFRQTFGMSELGIVRAKSRARNSLFMRIGGEGVQTRISKNILEIHATNRMLGYLNAKSPFDEEGWYNTKDVVEEDEGYIRVVGRDSDVINVGGLKFMASEVEREALKFSGIELAKAEGKKNPITGQHVELTVQISGNGNTCKHELKQFLATKLPPHMLPQRIIIGDVSVGHRFKKL